MGDDKRHAVTRMIDRLIETTVEYDITNNEGAITECLRLERARDRQRAALVRLAMSDDLRSTVIRLGVFVDQEHEYEYSGCHPTPGVHCVSWCEACAVLAAVPTDLMVQIRARRND